MSASRLIGSVRSLPAGALLAAALSGPLAAQLTERVSVDSLGTQANGAHGPFGSTLFWDSPSISADGRYVAFPSLAFDLVAGDTNGVSDIFVHDRQTGATERVSVDSLGAGGDLECQNASISADGRYVAFSSFATNLVVGDTNGVCDIFVHDLQTGATERVSVDSATNQADQYCGYPSISADGRYVAFMSEASNLVSGDTNAIMDLFVHDRQSGVTERASVSSLEAQGNTWSGNCSISADGRLVAFASTASNLVSGDTNGDWDIFVRDRQTGTTERVSVSSFGAGGNSWSTPASISADGRYVAFTSGATNLVSGDTNGKADIFVHDRQSGVTQRVSLDSLGTQGNGVSWNASISADGRYVAFQSGASNFFNGDTNFVHDIFVHDRQSGATDVVSVDSLGAHADDRSEHPSISADGNSVAFVSVATNLVNGDTNGASDIFVRARCVPASSATFSGDGINADTITPVNVAVGSSWSAPLTLGHSHGASGPLVLSVRSTTINGPNFTSSIGGRLTEVLIAGPLLAAIAGSHDGVSGDVPLQAIPNQLSLVGATWAAQYTAIGGGFGDLSQAVFGVVGCQ